MRPYEQYSDIGTHSIGLGGNAAIGFGVGPAQLNAGGSICTRDHRQALARHRAARRQQRARAPEPHQWQQRHQGAQRDGRSQRAEARRQHRQRQLGARPGRVYRREDGADRRLGRMGQGSDQRHRVRRDARPLDARGPLGDGSPAARRAQRSAGLRLVLRHRRRHQLAGQHADHRADAEARSQRGAVGQRRSHALPHRAAEHAHQGQHHPDAGRRGARDQQGVLPLEPELELGDAPGRLDRAAQDCQPAPAGRLRPDEDAGARGAATLRRRRWRTPSPSSPPTSAAPTPTRRRATPRKKPAPRCR